MNRRLKKPAGQHPTQRSDRRALHKPVDYLDGDIYLDDLKIGDAGAGYRRNHKLTIVSQLFENSDTATLVPFEQTYTVLMAPPMGQPIDNCRHRLWSVRFYGCSLIRMGDGGAEKFMPIRRGTGCVGDTYNQVPTPIKGWIRTDDGMFRCFDILGDRTVEVYGTHITAGFLAPINSYDLYTLAPDGSEDVAIDGIVDQSAVGVTISPIVVNSTQVNDDCTRCVIVPSGAMGATAVAFPIPPGSHYATISTPFAGPFGRDGGGVAVGLIVDFSWVPPGTGVFVGEGPSANMPVSGELVPYGQTRRLNIPGTPFMRFQNPTDGDLSVCVTFTKEL